MENLLSQLNFQDGLIPAVVADEEERVLVLCYMDREALRKTLQTGRVHVFRRSRGRLMAKGESSGHVQRLKELRVDCEENSLLLKVEQEVAACHAGYYSCYYRRYNAEEDALEIAEERVFDPEEVYGS